MKTLYTIREAAPLLESSVITVRRLIKQGDISYHRIGGRYFFTDDDLEEYLNQTAVPAKKRTLNNIEVA